MNIRLQGGKNASVYTGCQRAFSLQRAGDISALVCLNSHRQSAVRQHNHHTVPLLHLQPSSLFLSFTAVVFLLFITESVKCSSFFMRWLKRLTQHGSKWPQITACIGLNYEALFCGTHNKAVKPIWTLFTTGQMVIPYAQSTASFGTLALYDADPRNHSFSFSSSPLFPSWGGLVFVAPSLWPTRVNESHVFDGGEQSQSRDTAMEAFLQESIFNSGRGKQ